MHHELARGPLYALAYPYYLLDPTCWTPKDLTSQSMCIQYTHRPILCQLPLSLVCSTLQICIKIIKKQPPKRILCLIDVSEGASLLVNCIHTVRRSYEQTASQPGSTNQPKSVKSKQARTYSPLPFLALGTIRSVNWAIPVEILTPLNENIALFSHTLNGCIGLFQLKSIHP